MKELVEFIAQSIVDHPERVHVKETIDEDGKITYELTVDQGDKGRMIGKNGRVIQAVRSILIATASKENKWVNVTLRE